jgi:hypothetical protein
MLSHNISCPGQDSNQVSAEYRSHASPVQKRFRLQQDDESGNVRPLCYCVQILNSCITDMQTLGKGTLEGLSASWQMN